jgi:methylmalonyl-CoA mutase cobalamin-binding subunit
MSQRTNTRADAADEDLDRFALLALSHLAKELRMTGQLKQQRLELFSQELYAAVSSPDPKSGPAVIEKMFKAGFDPSEIADIYIPEVARRLGEAWCSDNLDFAVVTIGSARLQGLLRSLGPDWCAEDVQVSDSAPRCMLVVPETCQHTLGASILAGQMRRAGLSVSLKIGRSIEELKADAQRNRYDAVLISASTRESLDVIRRIVQNVRPNGRQVPVIIGGNVLAQNEDVARLTGADLATSELEEAIRFCGFDARMLRVVAEDL